MSSKKHDQLVKLLAYHLTRIISESNGISLNNTLELLIHYEEVKENELLLKNISEFRRLIHGHQQGEVDISTLIGHPVAEAFFKFFKNFPLPYFEEHIHLTGSLSAEFIYPRLMKLLQGSDGVLYENEIKKVYGETALPITSIDDVDNLIRLKEGEQFKTYLKILFLPKLILNSRQAHEEAAYHMAHDLYTKFNVGNIRLKFTLSRSSSMQAENIPGLDLLKEEDVVMGLYDGFMRFKKEHSFFQFVLSPSFRKEPDFFDKNVFKTKKESFLSQVASILKLIENHPELSSVMNEVDTVGDERELYRKTHFEEMKTGLRKLQYYGFSVRSHHGETWKNLRKGVQSVDNAMNIWHIDTLEHGLSLGINPNFYFQRLFQRISELNHNNTPITPESQEWNELNDMEWGDQDVLKKILTGEPLNVAEETIFLKTKFHSAHEIEHYQHDILNRMLHKGVTLTSLPSSNLKLTSNFSIYKDHPFSWWEKKGVKLAVGTDNYITLSTNYIQEMLILLFNDPDNLKITKLLMMVTKENRRPYISHLLWDMRKKFQPK
jgi:adenosine deaminase